MAKLGDLVSDVPPGGRLTLTSGSSVTTSDVTAATSVYYTPHTGNKITIYNGSEWLFHEFSELTLSLSGYTADTNYDIFICDISGTLTLESVAWSTATARATAITRQDGVYTKDGDATRRYLGTIRTTSTTGQCEDSEDRRFVWNYYNRQPRNMRVSDNSSHSYTPAAFRAWNNDSALRCSFVIGVVEGTILVSSAARHVSSASNRLAHHCVGYDSTTSSISNALVISFEYNGSASERAGSSAYRHLPTIGYHYYQSVEYGDGVAASTFQETYLEITLLG